MAGWLVVQVMVTEVAVRFVVRTLEITGAAELVTKVKFPEIDDMDAAFADTTSKLKALFGARPLSDTECVVVSVAFTGRDVP